MPISGDALYGLRIVHKDKREIWAKKKAAREEDARPDLEYGFGRRSAVFVTGFWEEE